MNLSLTLASLNASLELHRDLISIGFGAFELFAQADPSWAPEGFLNGFRAGPGEVGLSLGRWAVLVVNHRRVARGYA